MILIGSRAAKFWFDDFREPKDYDIIGSKDDFQKLLNNIPVIKIIDKYSNKKKIIAKENDKKIQIEFEFDERPSACHLLSKLWKKTNLFGMHVGVVSPAILWLTKRSHLYWRIHWEKSIEDMVWIKSRSHDLTTFDLDYYNLRLQETKNRFGHQFEYDISNYDTLVFRNKIQEMVIARDNVCTKDNYIRTLKEIATSRIYGDSCEAVIEFYSFLVDIDYDPDDV